ncbi:MAG: thioredoxin family protein [Thermodesulfobacteriota bacterium]|nr:thioredoxin family protein [Thermodesulfobacteriota bacterium]
MKKQWIALIIGLLLLVPNLGLAKSSQWFDDLEQAKIEAKKDNKHIFISFSGSDWCHWCIKFNKEVLSSQEFLDYADKNLVLMLVDFPKRQKQSKELKTRNDKLSREYGVRGFPSIAILNPAGKLIKMTGYRRGGAKAYIEHLNALISK